MGSLHLEQRGAGVAGLATHLGVEDGLVGDDEERVFLRMEFEDGGGDLIGLEASELGHGFGRNVEGADNAGFLGSAGSFLLLGHVKLIVINIHSKAFFLRDQLRQVDWKSEGVLKKKCFNAWNYPSFYFEPIEQFLI